MTQPKTPYDERLENETGDVYAIQLRWEARLERQGCLRALSDMDAPVRAIREALRMIAESPEGVYRTDPIEYRDNVIEWCQETARQALEAVEALFPEPTEVARE